METILILTIFVIFNPIHIMNKMWPINQLTKFLNSTKNVMSQSEFGSMVLIYARQLCNTTTTKTVFHDSKIKVCHNTFLDYFFSLWIHHKKKCIDDSWKLCHYWLFHDFSIQSTMNIYWHLLPIMVTFSMIVYLSIKGSKVDSLCQLNLYFNIENLSQKY